MRFTWDSEGCYIDAVRYRAACRPQATTCAQNIVPAKSVVSGLQGEDYENVLSFNLQEGMPARLFTLDVPDGVATFQGFYGSLTVDLGEAVDNSKQLILSLGGEVGYIKGCSIRVSTSLDNVTYTEVSSIGDSVSTNSMQYMSLGLVQYFAIPVPVSCRRCRSEPVR